MILAQAADTIDTQKLILQVVGVVVGGGLLQLIIFLIKRRATIRSIDITSDATQLTSANEFILTLQSEMKVLRAEIAELKAEVEKFKRQLSIAQDDATRATSVSEDTVTRLTLELARARSDLAVMKAELGDIARPTEGRHRGRGEL